jgi:hypothetical protein
MQRIGNKQFGTFELQQTLRPREQLRATRKRVVCCYHERVDFFLLPFLLGNAIVIMRTIGSSSSLGRLLFEENSHT